MVPSRKVKAAPPPPGSGGGHGSFLAAVPEPFGVEVEAEDKDYCEEQEYDCHNHYLACELNHTRAANMVR